MILAIKVKPNSKQQKIEKKEDNWYIYLKSPPVDGKANKELIKLLADYFHVKKSDVKIKSGLSNSRKIIEIND